MAYATVTLSGTYQTPDGTPHKGHVEIIPSERVIKDTTGDVILTGRVKVDLDAQGAFTVVLPATDDPTLNPTGFGYTIAAKLHSSHPPAVSFSLPAALGATTVEDLTPVDPSTFAPTTTYAEKTELDAVAATIPSTAADVNALPDTTQIPSTAADVGALPDTTTPTDIGAEPAGLAQATQDTLANTYGAKALVEKHDQVNPPGVMPFISGQADETPTVTGCTRTAETTIKRVGTQSHKLAIASATTATARWDAPAGQAITAQPLQAIGLMIYLENAAAINALTMNIYTEAGGANSWKFNAAALRGGLGSLRNGWNLLRWVPAFREPINTPAPWGTIGGVRVSIVTNAATNVYLQQVFFERRPKASVLFIHDGGYTDFYTDDYPALRDRGIPVTWSIDCALIGDFQHITEAQLAEVAAENRNSISFHGWDGTSTGTMTDAQLQTHTMRAIKWLGARGYSGRIWRSAWLQNSAPNSPATDPLVLVNPMGGQGPGSVDKVNAWPFYDRYDVNRVALHTAARNGTMDTFFAELKAHHGVLVCYTHSVDDAGGTDITPAEWQQFLDHMDTGMSEGWLEPVTLEMLLESSGVGVKQGLGGAVTVEWPNVDGTTEVMQLP